MLRRQRLRSQFDGSAQDLHARPRGRARVRSAVLRRQHSARRPNPLDSTQKRGESSRPGNGARLSALRLFHTLMNALPGLLADLAGLGWGFDLGCGGRGRGGGGVSSSMVRSVGVYSYACRRLSGEYPLGGRGSGPSVASRGAKAF